MREKGEVVSILDGKARIKIERSEACVRCGLCRAFGGQSLLEVESSGLPLLPGDEVTVETGGPGTLSASILVFLVPLIFFLIGVLAGRLLATKLLLEGGLVDLFGLGIGIAASSLIFFLLRIYENRLAKRGSFEVKIACVQRRD